MPVFRYTLEEMRRAQWLPAGDARIWPRLARLMTLNDTFVRVTRPPGVHRFRTIEEMNAFRMSWPSETLCKPVPPPPLREGRVSGE